MASCIYSRIIADELKSVELFYKGSVRTSSLGSERVSALSSSDSGLFAMFGQTEDNCFAVKGGRQPRE